MATEQEKLVNRSRIDAFTLVGLAAALWSMVGESAVSLAAPIGEEVLKLTEKEMGLKIAGETPETVLGELARLFVDEFGYCQEIKIEHKDNTFALYARNAITSSVPRQLKEAGVDKYYISPGMLTGLAALRRIGVKARGEVAPWPEGKGMVVTFQIV